MAAARRTVDTSSAWPVILGFSGKWITSGWPATFFSSGGGLRGRRCVAVRDEGLFVLSDGGCDGGFGCVCDGQQDALDSKLFYVASNLAGEGHLGLAQFVV